MNQVHRYLATGSAAASLVLGLAACTATTPDPEEPLVKPDPQSTDYAQSSPAPAPSTPQSGSIVEPAPTGDTEEPTTETEDWIQGASTRPAEPDGSRAIASGVRVASHDGYDRVVIDFTGTSTPGWSTDWRTEAHSQGLGDTLNLTGTAFLDITITGTNWPSEPGEMELYYSGPSVLDVGGISVAFDGTFEANTHLVIGVDQERPYQIFTLDDPTRVVIDVKN